MRHDQIYKAIRDTAKRLRRDEEYEQQESWQYATKNRKHLIDQLLSEYDPPEVTSDDDDQESIDEDDPLEDTSDE